MKIIPFVFITILFFSCKKNMDMPIPYSEASYKATITMDWSAPKFTVPAGVHVTPIIGIIHSKDISLWSPGTISTPGLEDVAEAGNNTKMNAELDAILLKNTAISKFTIPAPPVTGTVVTNFIFNTNYSYISFASMIAPSPDWFMGIHDVTLFDGKMWLNDVTVNILVYDAGTEDGDVFGYNNPDTNPQQKIALLTPANASVLANGNPSIAAIGTIHFVKN